MDLTILEIHLPDAEFNAPFAGGVSRPTGGDDTDTDDEAEVGSDTEGAAGGGSGRGGLVAALVLLGLIALAWYLRSGDESAEAAAAPE